jgi:nucleoside-diphosphate-sugar epimerase
VESLAGSDIERLVYMSSTSVYGEQEPLELPVREDVQPRPSRAYGKAKWKAEQAVWAAGSAGLPVVVLRPVSVYGPRNVKLLASVVLDAAIERFAGQSELVVAADPVELRLVHIDDVVRASMHLARHEGAEGRAFNVVFPEYPTNHRIVDILAPAFDMTPVLSDTREPPLSYAQRAATRSEMLGSGMRPDILLTEERFRLLGKANINNRLSGEALSSTGFTFRDDNLDAPIESTVEWYRDNRWILG